MRIPKSIAIILGLLLGWWAAGFVQSALTGGETHDAGAGSLTAPVANAATEPAETHAPAREKDAGVAAAQRLVPDEQPTFFPFLTASVIVLFLLAAIVGSAALLIKGPEPPDPAEAHH